MLFVILILLIAFWLLGYGPIEAFTVPLFRIGAEAVTIWDLLVFFVIIWLITSLPGPFRQIAAVLFIIWILSIIGILAIPGLSSMVLIAIIVGLFLYILQGR